MNQQATLSPQEQQDGWKLLFNGKDYTGWHNYGKQTIGQAWKIVDGAMFLDASDKENWQVKGGGDILTDEEFDNFHLQLEWKISAKGNSGIIFLIHEDTTNYAYCWQTGLEMQILDNNGHADGKIIKHRAGDLYDLITAQPEAAKPVGEWNQAEIIVQKGTLEFILNKQSIVKTNLWDTAWNGLVNQSKFIKYANWGTFKKGKIALQDHGDNVWYKNIKIKRLY